MIYRDTDDMRPKSGRNTISRIPGRRPAYRWCGPYTGQEVCHIRGDYAGMTAAISYLKKDMPQVAPEDALSCVRAVGDLFRVTL